MSRLRVVVTGMGAVTPLGNSSKASWAACSNGTSGIARITGFDASNLTTQIAGEVKGFNAAELLGVKEARRSSRCIHMALCAAREALAQSGLDPAADPGQVGVLIGSGIGGLEFMERATLALYNEGPRRISPFTIPAMISDMPAGMVAIDIGARGPNMGVVSACATGSHAIGEAAEWIRRGRVKAVLAGGTEAAITPLGVAAFGAMQALSTRNDDPARASRPFDRDRDGFVPGEGAAVLVLEEADHARARGATVLAEIAGYGATDDASHITQPDAKGEGARRAITLALEDAGATPDEVDYINAHGTSTQLNDVAETHALKAALGKRAYAIPTSSTKSMTGHLLGAAGAVEAMFCIQAIAAQFVPPTVNLDNPDPECDLDYVPGTGRAHPVRLALSTSFGFGGHNACLAFRHPG